MMVSKTPMMVHYASHFSLLLVQVLYWTLAMVLATQFPSMKVMHFHMLFCVLISLVVTSLIT